MLDLTREEQELIRLLRGGGGEFQLMITSRYGHADVRLMAPLGPRRMICGTGDSFSEAWQDAKLQPNTYYVKDASQQAHAQTPSHLPQRVGTSPLSYSETELDERGTS